MTVDTVAHLDTHLPTLLRSLFAEDWRPSELPVRYDAYEFVGRYAHAARIAEDDVLPVAAAVTGSLRGLRRRSLGTRLENAVPAPAEAVTELVRGMEPEPSDEPDTARTAQAARRTHQVVLGIEPYEHQESTSF